MSQPAAAVAAAAITGSPWVVAAIIVGEIAAGMHFG